MFFVDAASFLLVIAVLIWRARSSPAGRGCPGGRGYGTAVPLAAGPPRSVQVAAGMALLVGGFGIQFEVTNR